MSQPLNRNCRIPVLGDMDKELGEFWVENPFMMMGIKANLSSYERNRAFVNVDGKSFIDASFASAMDLDSEHRVSLAGYTKPFLDVCVVVTLSALLVSYLIFTADQDAMVRLGSEKLYLTTPYVIAGVFRYLQLTLVEERSGSPTSLLFDDPFLMVTVAAWLATYIYMIHF